MNVSDAKTPKPRPVRGLALGFGIVFGLSLFALFPFVRPAEWGEAKLRFRLWRAGAVAVRWEKHRGFTEDRCAGAAPADCPCVWFVHGMGDSAVTWRNFFLDPGSFDGRAVRLFAMDLPGHGSSLRRRDPSEYRVSRMADELNAGIAATAECRTNVLVGNSFGGWVAARMAYVAPGKFARLVLVGPAGVAASEEATKDLFREPSVESLKEFQRRAYFKPRELSDREWAAAAERMKHGSTGEIRDAQTPDERMDDKLGRIDVDTLLVHGEADRIIPRAVIDVYAKGLPHREVVTIPECGHLPQKECPQKLFPIIRSALPK
ncbi:MAG: alpha/beta hydrolase [Bdellovibrionales bacterium]|nr:alpha/beta hydrolase [Bdellovibrionales bacterium]